VNTRKWLHRLGPTIGVLLLAGAFWIVHRQLRAYRYADLARAVREIPPARVVIALMLTAANYWACAMRDIPSRTTGSSSRRSSVTP
jgi:uncharacterized membrane protein YbhN (UPF0104 family)